MKPQALLKTLQHPTLRSAVSGTLVLLLCFVLLSVLDPAGTRRLPLLWTVLACCVVVLLPFPITYRLVTGRLSLSSWARRFFWAVVFPWALIIGHFTAYVPGYVAVFFVLFVGGGSVGVGIIPLWSYIANTAFMLVLFLISLYFVQPEFLFDFPPLLALSLPLVWLSSFWVGQASNYYIARNESASRLLRGSRRDKRLVAEERQRSDLLLLNILPESIADELKQKGSSAPVLFDDATVLFTDFEGFTRIAETMHPEELVRELDQCFSYFDSVVERYNLEKLKTIGDAYMCAGGLPQRNNTHAVDCVLAALEIQAFMNRMKEVKQSQGFPYWELRLGIHSGPLVAGVIGEKKFAYDVWGDTVNTASRCETAGSPGRINISSAVYERVKDFFECTYRGRLPIKNKGEIEMYFVERILPELSRAGDGLIPGEGFEGRYAALAATSADA